jgi:DNA ligase 1
MSHDDAYRAKLFSLLEKCVDMKPMLAKAPEDKFPLKYPRLASSKLDGIRGIVKDGMLLSRTLTPIPNRYTQHLFGCDSLNGLDGELCVGPPNEHNLMQRCQSELMAEDGQPDVTFWVFDYWTYPNLPYATRYANLVHSLPDMHPHVKLLPHAMVNSQIELEDLQATFLAAGFEGMISRDPAGPYKYGRSTAKEGWMIKHKPWIDMEAVVIGFEEGYHNQNEATVSATGHTKRSTHQENMVPAGTLGALVCALGEGEKTVVSFKVSPGIMDAAMRKHVWDNREQYRGAIVTFTTFKQTGVKDKPRFNIFKAFRDKRDM